MKEFDNYTCNEDTIFNDSLRGAENKTECAFGRLKARWMGYRQRKIDMKSDKNKFHIDEKLLKLPTETIKK